ncbi:hypothetical protein ABZX12_17840 [Kribbella sp. NPDC003505]|uniref:hypothetical protein n=1 Tax=Kribbella sp. NPDC003505 TaxID=3154448 RepID=UPI0033B16132
MANEEKKTPEQAAAAEAAELEAFDKRSQHAVAGMRYLDRERQRKANPLTRRGRE